jgi:hypothetical protein
MIGSGFTITSTSVGGQPARCDNSPFVLYGRLMARVPLTEAYVAVLPRPETVKEWSDIDNVLEERAQRLIAALGSGWKMEGPLYEAEERYISLTRQLRVDPQKHEDVNLVVSLGIEVSGEPLPPDPLPIMVHGVEENQFVPPTTKAGEFVSYVMTGAVMVGAAAVWLLVRRAIGGMFLPVLAAIVALIALLIAAIVLKSWILGEPAQPTEPSPEFLAVVKTVKEHLPPSSDAPSGNR